MRGKFVRRRKATPVSVSVLAEELARSCRTRSELEALVRVCTREHGLDAQAEGELRAAAEAALHRRFG